MARVGQVNITKKCRVNGVWKLCPAVMGGNNRLRPNVVTVNGVEETHPEGRYYIDYLQGDVRKRLAAGATAAEATTFAEATSKTLNARAVAADAGLPIPEIVTKAEADVPAGKRSLKETVNLYLLETEAHKKPKTLAAYRTALNYFLESCRKAAVEDITRTDLLHYTTYLRKSTADRKGQADRSVANKFENLMTFLKWSKVKIELGKNDWPKYTEEEVETYTQDELDKFFAACTETENLWFRFFYGTAMREQEVMNCDWSWIDFDQKTATVRENARTGFKPKAYKGRHIPLSPSLVALLKTWKSKQDRTCGLVFPTAGCNPKLDFLDECKAIAKRAGLDPKKFYLHKFRATRATRLLQGDPKRGVPGMNIRAVMRVLGHKDMESALRYQGAQENDVLQQQVSQLDEMGVV